MEITRENIEALILERKESYRNVDDAVAAFNREQELQKEYDGRQILEMIQNADDAEATEMAIAHGDGVLVIANNGNSFTYEGIKSILISNLSSKVKSSYIGNKGLGFRSLLSWAKEISIETAGFRFTFSREVAEQVAYELKHDFDEIRTRNNLSDTAVPFPVLGIPKFEQLENDKVKCKISIVYDPSAGIAKKIDAQLNSIDEKTLLFLRKVKKVVVNGNEIVENADAWEIKEFSKELPSEYQDKTKNEKKFWVIKLAIPKSGQSQTYKLYNYLPTNEDVHLPYVVHASLELDSARNHINNLDVNRYVLSQVADCISSYVDESIKSSAVDWTLYSMMTPTDKSSTIINECLYRSLEELRDRKQIFPTISGKFCRKDEYHYYDNLSSSFWKEFPHTTGSFKNLLMPVPECILGVLQPRKIDIDAVNAALRIVSYESGLANQDRVSLVTHLMMTDYLSLDGKVNLLTTKDDPACHIFTPHNGVQYDLPEGVKIEFLERDLYEGLVDALESMINDCQADDESGDDDVTDEQHDIKTRVPRRLCAILKDKKKLVANIYDYDKDKVLKAVVSQVNDNLNGKDLGQCREIIGEMVDKLYRLYDKYGFDVVLEGVNLLDMNGCVRSANELVMQTEDNKYVFGDHVPYLYGDFGIEERDNYLSFMRHLGVERVFKKNGEIHDLLGYGQWLQKQGVISGKDPHSPVCLSRSRLHDTMLNPSLIPAFDKIPLNRLVYFLCKNDEFFEYFSKEITLEFQYRKIHRLNTPYTYLRYQFLELRHVKNRILYPDIVLCDFDESGYPAAIDDLRKKEVIRFLTTNMYGMSPRDISDAVNCLADRGVSQAVARKLYKSIIETAAKKDELELEDDIRLLAVDCDGKQQYCPVKDVYYTDNTSLPKKIIEKLGKKKFSYPSRQGAEKICGIFGIDPLSNKSPEVIRTSVRKHEAYAGFSHLLESMKPYILLYYLQNSDIEDVKKSMASLIRGLVIELVSDAEYELDGNTGSLDAAEFLCDKSRYYLKVDQGCTIPMLQNSVEYCAAIAEIFAIQTHVQGHNDSVIRIFQNLEFMKKTAEKDFSETEVKQAFSLLGLSLDELDLWQALLGRHLDYTDRQTVYEEVRRELRLEEDFNFACVNFKKWNTQESVKLLDALNSVKPELLKKLDLSELHQAKWRKLLSYFRREFQYALWKELSDKSEEQKHFVSHLSRYEFLACGLSSHAVYSDDEYTECFKAAVSEEFPSIRLVGLTDVDEPKSLYPQYDGKMNNLSPEDRSLFYFCNNEVLIAEKLEKQADELLSENEAVPTISDDASIIHVDISKLKPAAESTAEAAHNATHVQHVHSDVIDVRKKNAGRRAELIVKDLFVREGYRYAWLSGFSDEPGKNDSLGYDFEYCKPGESYPRCLEVKAYSGHGFIISSNEYEMAKKYDHFDIALVDGDKVYIIEDFFKSDGFTLAPTSYRVLFDLKV